MTSKNPTKTFRTKLATLAAEQTGKPEVPPDSDHAGHAENPADVTLKGMAALRQRQIFNAIEKLDNDAYGICEDCGGVGEESSFDQLM